MTGTQMYSVCFLLMFKFGLGLKRFSKHIINSACGPGFSRLIVPEIGC